MTNKEISARLDSAWDVLGESKDPKMLPTMKFLGNHLENPRSYVTFTGETSSGKSTLINSLIGRKFLPAGVRPTTGTVVWLEFGVSDKERLLAINRDATLEEISESQFCLLSEHPDEGLLRLKAEMPHDSIKGLSVFDTPGFNAVISEHEEVLKEFLPESDVVVFPVSYRVGFGSSDRRLMELVGDVRDRFGKLPVILVVNRAPENATSDDKRIKEILLNAEDSLHDKVLLQVVHATMPAEDGTGVLPDTSALWKAICDVTFSAERAAMLTHRFEKMLNSIVEQRVSELDGEIAAAGAGRGALDELNSQIEEFLENESRSYNIVEKYMSKISRELPKLLDHEVAGLLAHAKHEIMASNKWVDVHQCSAFIYGHVLPFGTTGVVKNVEEYLRGVFDRMDEELSEMANLAIRHINDRAQTIEDPKIGTLLSNLGMRIGQRVAGEMASTAVRSVGGVGGAAAGFGNVAKMAVKHIGKLFGTTFGREVYVNIGKIFTKRMVQTMSVCLQAVTELAFFAWDACHWQSELVQKVSNTLSGWRDEVSGQIEGKMIEEYRQANIANVRDCYSELRREVESEIENVQRSYSKSDLVVLSDKRESLLRLIGNKGVKYGKV